MKKQAIVAVIVIVVALAVLIAIQGKKADDNSTGENQPNTNTQTVKTQEVPVEKTPAKFPEDIPLEAGAKVTQNYNATLPDGRFQATRAFETAKSLAENFKLYQDALTQNGYTISSTLDQPTIKAIAAQKGDTQVQLNFNENSLTKVRTVEISITVFPKK